VRRGRGFAAKLRDAANGERSHPTKKGEHANRKGVVARNGPRDSHSTHTMTGQVEANSPVLRGTRRAIRRSLRRSQTPPRLKSRLLTISLTQPKSHEDSPAASSPWTGGAEDRTRRRQSQGTLADRPDARGCRELTDRRNVHFRRLVRAASSRKALSRCRGAKPRLRRLVRAGGCLDPVDQCHEHCLRIGAHGAPPRA